MRGGARENAGRSKLGPDKKKITKSVHLNPKLFEKIQELQIDGCDSFSSKCQYLIQLGFNNIKNKQNIPSDKLTFIDLLKLVTSKTRSTPYPQRV